MNKKLIIIAFSIMVLIIMVVGTLLLRHSNKSLSPNVSHTKVTRSEILPTNAAEAKATLSNNSPTCRTDKTQQFTLSNSMQQGIDLAIIGQLIDIPAGTNVDVHLNTYSPVKLTGSEVYGTNYGSYNFTATKQSEKADWRITELVACT